MNDMSLAHHLGSSFRTLPNDSNRYFFHHVAQQHFPCASQIPNLGARIVIRLLSLSNIVKRFVEAANRYVHNACSSNAIRIYLANSVSSGRISLRPTILLSILFPSIDSAVQLSVYESSLRMREWSMTNLITKSSRVNPPHFPVTTPLPSIAFKPGRTPITTVPQSMKGFSLQPEMRLSRTLVIQNGALSVPAPQTKF